MTEKFGKVFISTQIDADKHSEYRPVGLATFSNFDFKWYTLMGDIHPKYDEYKNHYFSLGYQVENLNKDGGREPFKGRLLLPIKLTEYGNGPDSEYLTTFKKMERELAVKLELLDVEDDEQVAVFEKSQAIMAFVLPEEKLFLKSPLLLYLSMAVMLDDIVDSDNSGESTGFSDIAKDTSYSQCVQMLQPGVLALKGQSQSQIRQAVNSSSFFFRNPNLGLHDALSLQRYVNAYIRMSEGLREGAMQISETETEAVPFLTCVKQMFEAVCLDSCKEWNVNSFAELFQGAQVELRKYTSGIPVTIEAAALQLGIQLKSEVRESFLFNWWLGEMAYHSGKINDLLSYNREMETGGAERNEVYKLHKEQGQDLQQALGKVERDANECIKRILKGAEILVKMFEGDKQLERYINVAKRVVTGLVQSNCYVKRWHSNITWDCYVEFEIEQFGNE